MIEPRPGDVAWADFGLGVGREQSGRRPVVVVAAPEYLGLVDSMSIVVPVTSRGRGWPNHVRLSGETGLSRPSWALTEQPRTISRDRVHRVVGWVDLPCLDDIRMWLRDFLDL